MSSKSTLVWFLLGMGAQFQIVASLSMTELFVLLAAPLLIFREYPKMKRNGVLPLFVLSLFVVIGCICSCIINGVPAYAALRGGATTCLISCSIVVSHWVLRRDLGGFKWFLIGSALSFFLSTFVFQHSVEVTMLADGRVGASAVVDAIMSGPIFWTTRLSSIIGAVLKGWYLQLPTSVCGVVPLILALFAVLISESGRSIALGLIAMSMLVFIGGRSPERIKRLVCRRLGLLIGVSIMCLFIANQTYRYAALNGLMGEKSRIKYEKQSHGSDSITKLLLTGRMDSFCGLLACMDRPILGYGPWAIDDRGYISTFLSKYADEEDYRDYVELTRFYSMQGTLPIRLIPCHSFITQFWLWYGVMGLIFWLYAIYVVVRYLKSDCFAVPQMFMWLAAGVPAFLWNVFFSPFSDRFGTILFLTACLMVRAVRKGTLQLPERMKIELSRYER